MNYAVIDHTGTVINTIEWDGTSPWLPESIEHTVGQVYDGMNVGDQFKGKRYAIAAIAGLIYMQQVTAPVVLPIKGAA